MRIVSLNDPDAPQPRAGDAGSEERGLLNALPAVILQCTHTGRIVSVSDKWKELTGVSPADSIGRELLTYILPEDHSLLSEQFSSNIPQGPINQTVRYRNPDGRAGWIQLDLHESRLADGAGGYIGLVTDITDRVGREASLLAQHRTLSGILDDLPGMVFRCRNDPDWTMEYVSGGSLSLTGYRPGEIINNRRLSYGSLIVPEDRDKVWNVVQTAIRERRGYDLDYRIETESGDIRHVWERAKGVYSASNDLLGLEGFITDITRYRQRFQPLRAEDLYLEDGETLTRVLFEDRVRHRVKRLKDSADADGPGSAFGCLCLYFDNLGDQLADASDRRHAAILGSLVDRVRSICATSDSVHIDVTGQILLLVDQVTSRQQLENLAEALQSAFFEPLAFDDLQLLLTLSIGAVYCDDLSQDLPPVTVAEESMRRISETGGNHWRVVRL